MEFTIPAIGFTLGSIVVLIMLFRTPKYNQGIFRGSVILSLLITTLSSIFILPASWQLGGFVNRGFVASCIVMLALISIGHILFSYLTFHPRKLRIEKSWYVASVIGLVAYILTTLIAGNLPQNTVLSLPNEVVPSLLGLVITGLIGGVLVMIMLWDFYRVTLPELANRSVFWVFIALFGTAGAGFISSSLPSLVLPGLLFSYLTLVGLLYAYTTARILNMRLGLFIVIRNMTILALLTVIILIPVYAVDQLNLANDVSGTLVIISIAIALAALVLPLLQLIRDVFRNLTETAQTNLSVAIAAYSREVSLSTNLEEVVTATTTTLNHVLNIKRSGLILINNTFRKENAVEFVVLSGVPMVSGSNRLVYVSKDSPLYHVFTHDRAAVTQYDIDFDPHFADIPDTERKFFQSLYLRAYAPIVTENNLIGIIGCGPKLDDTSYTAEELELLLVIGQQVGTALRSARLIDDLRHLNTSMRSLNSQLQIAKQDLEKLDSIKTDFVTIASHELRTPLAQVRGYSDIIDSLNEQGILDAKQTTSLVNNLRRATERMEELISAMMDVSQLDVNAMDLHLVRTKPDMIIKLAIDPLTDAIEQRKLKIERVGLTDLPAIQADMQRIVQAFSNIIVNAIKFTPDGGKIEITGKTEVHDNTDHVTFIIKDSGVGIQPHDIELIFQKFYRGFDPQLHSTGTYKFMGAGPGLGTTIAKGIIEGHGGRIWAESPGHDMENLPGATFYISMPVNPPEDAKRVLPFDPESVPASDERKTAELPPVTAAVTEANPLDSIAGRNRPTEARKPTES